MNRKIVPVSISLVFALMALSAVSGAAVSTGTPIPAITSTGKIITLADDGKTVNLQTGEQFLLKLGENYDWIVTVDNQTVLSRVVNILVIKGAQGVYEAHAPGNATLTAIGDPICRKARPPCAAPSRVFRIQVIVSGTPPTPRVTPTLTATPTITPVAIPEYTVPVLPIIAVAGLIMLLYRRGE